MLSLFRWHGLSDFLLPKCCHGVLILGRFQIPHIPFNHIQHHIFHYLNKLKKIDTIIIQSNTKIELLRKEVTKLNYLIEDELLVEDNKKVKIIKLIAFYGALIIVIGILRSLKDVSLKEAMDFSNYSDLLLSRRENGFLLSDYQVSVLNRFGIKTESAWEMGVVEEPLFKLYIDGSKFVNLGGNGVNNMSYIGTYNYP